MSRPIIIERDPRGKNKPDQTHRIENRDEYDKITSDDKNLWIRHDILKDFQKELKKDRKRDSYEDFVYGFMYHFDNHSPKEKWDVDKEGPHQIYFKWVESNGDVVAVEIFIIPAPKEPFKRDSTVINTGVDPEKPPAPPPPPANP